MQLICEELDAEAVNKSSQMTNLVEDIVIGAMSVQNAMQFFKRGVLVIIPGDREDILLAAAAEMCSVDHSGLAGIVLTGNLRPGEHVMKLIMEMPFPVLLARQDSYEVASKVHDMTVKTRPDDTEKITLIRDMIAEHVDVKKILGCALRLWPSRSILALKQLPVYQPGRPIEEVARELGLPASEIIKLASNENPFGPSPLALAAMEKALQLTHLYPDGNAFYLKRKLAAKLGVEPANLILGNGSNEIIEFVGHALLDARIRSGRVAILLRGLSDRHPTVRRHTGHRSRKRLWT